MAERCIKKNHIRLGLEEWVGVFQIGRSAEEGGIAGRRNRECKDRSNLVEREFQCGGGKLVGHEAWETVKESIGGWGH